jgi:hypothetical protein
MRCFQTACFSRRASRTPVLCPLPFESQYRCTFTTLRCLTQSWICLHLHYSSRAGRVIRPGLPGLFITLFLPSHSNPQPQPSGSRSFGLHLFFYYLTRRNRSAYRRLTSSQAVLHLFETHRRQTAKVTSAVATMVQWTTEKDAVVSLHSTFKDIPRTDHLLSSWSASSSMRMSRSVPNSGMTPPA